MSQLEYFKLPISYLDNKCIIDDHINNDINLTSVESGKDEPNSVPNSEPKSEPNSVPNSDINTETDIKKTVSDHDHDPEIATVYDSIFKEKSNILGKQTIPLWAKYYTSDKKYIKDTQTLLKTDFIKTDCSFNDIYNVWCDIKQEQNFIDKYQYIDWTWLEFLNNHAIFLQILSLYNMTSPILTLALPIIMLILPFFLIKLQSKNITLSEYYSALVKVFSTHQIGQLFTFSSATWDKRVYIIVSFAFYLFQIYQNIAACVKFFSNIKIIHSHLFITRDFVTKTLEQLEDFSVKTDGLSSYSEFNKDIKKHTEILEELNYQLNKITPCELKFSKIHSIGHLMYCFYQVYKTQSVLDAIDFAVYFQGYINNLESIKLKLGKTMSFCKLTKKKTYFVNAYNPTITHCKPIKNTYNLDKQILITGPNAAGKTTLLKTTLINIILSQQLGCGFYSNARLCPYDYIHCYINIPDTSGRDSLFQAEARRCKDIIDNIANYSSQRHFCIFDELYSGTNPYEAIASATSFLKYLNKFPNVSYIITTHFIDLCQKLNTDKRVQNCHMKTEGHHKDIQYTYKLIEGISKVRGGTKVLYDLKYPDSILKNAESIIDKLDF